MSNIIKFRPAKELVIETTLKSVTLADILYAIYEQTDFEQAMIVTRNKGGELLVYSDLETYERELMIEDLYDGDE